MKKILIFGIFLTSLSNVSFASTYKIDDASIDAICSESVENNLSEASSVFAANYAHATLAASDPNPWAAFAICWIVGGVGVHRHYMGTQGSMWAIYTFTCCGIFGVVPFVDWIVLLIGAINDDISKYVNNDAFFMWK